MVNLFSRKEIIFGKCSTLIDFRWILVPIFGEPFGWSRINSGQTSNTFNIYIVCDISYWLRQIVGFKKRIKWQIPWTISTHPVDSKQIAKFKAWNAANQQNGCSNWFAYRVTGLCLFWKINIGQFNQQGKSKIVRWLMFAPKCQVEWCQRRCAEKSDWGKFEHLPEYRF